jgi:hypothetical protein
MPGLEAPPALIVAAECLPTIAFALAALLSLSLLLSHAAGLPDALTPALGAPIGLCVAVFAVGGLGWLFAGRYPVALLMFGLQLALALAVAVAIFRVAGDGTPDETAHRFELLAAVAASVTAPMISAWGLRRVLRAETVPSDPAPRSA